MSGAGSSLVPTETGCQRFRKDPAAFWAGWFLVAVGVACLLSPWIAPYDYQKQDLALGAVGPGAGHWLGTDTLGRDVLSRLLQGGAVSLGVGLVATVVALLVGVLYGVVAGQSGGLVERAMMRTVDILSTLPLTLIVILCMFVFGQNIWMIFLAVGGVSWLTMSRIICTETVALKNRQFVEVSVALGQSKFGVFKKHYLPNLNGIIAIYATLTVPGVMMLEAFVSFLGLGVQAPMTSWGLMIKDGADIMEECPWLLIAPSVVFALTLLSLNFVGDGLRDAFDPRSSKK
ncbi:peptide ABC transporter permease [Verrucomicrobiota bacterium]|nr:oligopeptide transport system permease protein OppC [Verrucomicrobiota bacterium]GDY17265.1 peptide ABC transporter permease [Verrucomicrobiota bacterium]